MVGMKIEEKKREKEELFIAVEGGGVVGDSAQAG